MALSRSGITLIIRLVDRAIELSFWLEMYKTLSYLPLSPRGHFLDFSQAVLGDANCHLGVVRALTKYLILTKSNFELNF